MDSQNAIGNIVTLIIGVAVATMVLIFAGVLAGQTYQLTEPRINLIGNNVVTNAGVALTSNNDTYVNMDIHPETFNAYNSTGTNITRNVTLDYTNGTIDISTNFYVDKTIYLNYTYGRSQIGSAVKDSALSGFTALKQTGDYLPLVVLAVIIVLILGIIMAMMVFGGGTGGSGFGGRTAL